MALIIEKSLDEYIANPITTSLQDKFVANTLLCTRYEKAIARLLMIAFVLMTIAFFALWTISFGFKNGVDVALLSFTLAFTVTTSAIINLPNFSLKKYPMKIAIDGTNVLRGYSGEDFNEVTLNSSAIVGSEPALRLFQNIKATNRNPYEIANRGLFL